MSKKYLVTGGSGFIGSNFINYIFKKYENIFIVNIDAMYYSASNDNILEEIRNSNRYVFTKGNLNSIDLLNYILNKYEIDTVIHFAAQSHVDNSFENSIQYTIDNILGTHTLLEACRIYGKLYKFIHFSTDEVYGESMSTTEEKKKSEESILLPTNPYAATKASSEMIAQSYFRSFKIPITITRGNNVYGPNQYPEKLIPKFISLLNQNKKVTIHGDGLSIRAFIHVNDVCNAVDIIISKGNIGEIYNIGCDNEYSVIDIANILINKIKNTHKYDNWIEYVSDRPFNDKRYYISNQKLMELGWKIEMNFEDGINSLISKIDTKI